ncbi:hypothetical protein, partial [Caballeronia sp. M23-90]
SPGANGALAPEAGVAAPAAGEELPPPPPQADKKTVKAAAAMAGWWMVDFIFVFPRGTRHPPIFAGDDVVRY